MNKTALAITIFGAINWGMIALFNYNLVTSLFGVTMSRIIYGIVALAGLWCINLLFKHIEHNEILDH